jgi:hypothetical protein
MWTLEQLTGHVFIVLTGCSAVTGRSPPANSCSKMKFNNGLEHIHGTHVKITNGFIKRSEEQSNIGKHLRNYCCSENVTLHLVCLSTLYHKQHCFRFKKALNVKCVFWFYLQLCLKNHILSRIHRYIIIYMYTCVYKVPVIVVRFYWNLNFLTFFEQFSSIKFHQNPSNGSRVVPCGQTELTKLIRSCFS